MANKCASQKWNVAIVEAREFGGTCALRGCNPKKVLVRAAELVDHAWRTLNLGGSAAVSYMLLFLAVILCVSFFNLVVLRQREAGA